MIGGMDPSESLTWWGRAAQARRVAIMLSPRDAQLAEAYAAECENRALCFEQVRQGVVASRPSIVDPVFEFAAKITVRRAA
jgi:hypothetical protein